MKKRIVSLLLIFCLLICVLPALAPPAAATSSVPTVQLGADGIAGYDATSGYNYVYYGSWNSAPIQWRVLDDEASTTSTATPVKGLFLLSEALFGVGDSGLVFFNFENGVNGNATNIWAGSEAEKWCNDFAGLSSATYQLPPTYDPADYPSPITPAAFNTAEQAALIATALSDVALAPNASAPSAKVFFLSKNEATSASYGFADATRIGKYANGSAAPVAKPWSLRSPATLSDLPTWPGLEIVTETGAFAPANALDSRTARPALNLDPDNILLISQASGGTATGKSASGMADGLAAITSTDSVTHWKLTLLDSARQFAVSEDSRSVQDGGIVTLSYTGAETGANEYISAMLLDAAGKPAYYGRIKASNAAAGSVGIALPSGLTGTAATDYTLYVFNEQFNGDTAVDLSSAFDTVALTVEPPAHTHPSCGSSCSHTGTAAHGDVTFTAWTQADDMPAVSGSYYLTGDVQLTNAFDPDPTDDDDYKYYWHIPAGVDITLCLNGHMLSFGGDTRPLIDAGIHIAQGGSLTLCDCNGSGGTHTFTENAAGRWNPDPSGALSVTGGVICNTDDGDDEGENGILCQGVFTVYSGAIAGCQTGVLNTGTFAMHGGDIIGCFGDGVQARQFDMFGGTISHCRIGVSIHTWGGSAADTVFNMYDGAIKNIVSGSHGGVVLQDGTFNMYGGSIVGNSTRSDGGGVYVENGTFNMHDGLISDNVTGSDGGGVYVENGTFNMYDGSIIDNRADDEGGGVYADLSTFHMHSGLIDGNVAGFTGGGMYLHISDFTLHAPATGVSAGQISNNTADRNGGGIAASGSTLILNGGTVSGNACLKNGGGVYINNVNLNDVPYLGSLTLNSCAITGNTAGENGGGVCNVATTKLLAGSISGNTAIGTGGGISNRPNSILDTTGGAITGNTAAEGGGVYNLGVISLTGAPDITGNTGDDLFVSDEKGSLALVTVGDLDAAASIGINMDLPGVFSTGGQNHADRFTSNIASCIVAPKGDDLQLTAAPGQPDVTLTLAGQNVKWYADAACAGSPITGFEAPKAVPLALYLTADDGYCYPAAPTVAGASVQALTGSIWRVYLAPEQDATLTPSDPIQLTHFHPACGSSCTHGGTHSTVGFVPWTDADAMPGESGIYCLETDVELDDCWTVPQDVTLCLNGYNISYTGSGISEVIYIADDCSLTLCDCNGSGGSTTFEPNSVGLWVPDPDGSKTVTGGSITGGTYSGIYSEGSFAMYGGALVGNTEEDGGMGGGIYNDGSFAMYGGAITGNQTFFSGGGVYNYGEFLLAGGKIADNACYDSSYPSYGGGVYNDGIFNVTGGSITDNYANYGGGVYQYADPDVEILISGVVVITGNTNETTADNLYLEDACNPIAVDALFTGSSIGISMYAPGVFSLNGVASIGCFASDDVGYIVQPEGQGMKLAAATPADPGHTHLPSPVGAASSNCTDTQGNNAYYHCAGCNLYFKDLACTQQTTPQAEALPLAPHSYTQQLQDDAHLVPGADCNGFKQYYYDCATCDSMGTDTWQSTQPGDHSFTAWGSAAFEHWRYCSVPGCGVIDQDSRDDHSMQQGAQRKTDAAGDYYDLHCGVCQYTGKARVHVIRVPYDTIIRQTNTLAPGAMDFSLVVRAAIDGSYSVIDGSVSTNGMGTYGDTLVIEVIGDQALLMCSDGFTVYQQRGSAAGWTYSDAVWMVTFRIIDGPTLSVGEITITDITSDNLQTTAETDRMSFTNSYDAAPAAPETPAPAAPAGPQTPATGDNTHPVLWIILLGVSACAFVLLILAFRQKQYISPPQDRP